MIIITGAAGFIGSCITKKLNDEGYIDLILVDDFSNLNKNSNFENKKYYSKVSRENFFDSEILNKNIDFIIHIGARTDTTEINKTIFDKLNLNYSKKIWNFCTKHQIPLIYASSAATYGNGKLGYDDKDDSLIYKLKPLNLYGESKNDFDKWILEQKETPPNWYGLKFFNVYGPNEYHKGKMSSVIYHSYNQIILTGKVKLFKSHNENFKDGEQLRDFIYVMDIIDVIYFLMKKTPKSGIYNLGTGKARTFLDLVNSVFYTLNKPPDIEFIDTPIKIRNNYQYFTEAKMEKLFSIGYNKNFYTLEEGVNDYIQKYLSNNITF